MLFCCGGGGGENIGVLLWNNKLSAQSCYGVGGGEVIWMR